MLKFHYIFSTSKLYPCAFFPLQDFSPFTLEFSRRVFSTTRFLTIYTRVFSVRFFHYKISRHLHQSFLCAFFPLQLFSSFTLEFVWHVVSTTRLLKKKTYQKSGFMLFSLYFWIAPFPLTAFACFTLASIHIYYTKHFIAFLHQMQHVVLTTSVKKWEVYVKEFRGHKIPA